MLYMSGPFQDISSIFCKKRTRLYAGARNHTYSYSSGIRYTIAKQDTGDIDPIR